MSGGLKIPGSDDRFIDYETYAELVRRVEALEQVRFDPDQFDELNDGTIRNVSISSVFAAASTTPMPFDVTKSSTAKYVSVRGGYIRFAGSWANRTTISDIDCSAGTSGGFIYYTLTRSTGVVSAILYKNTYPTEDDDIRVYDIATLYQESDGTITSIEQTRHGDFDHQEKAERDSVTRTDLRATTLPRTSYTALTSTWTITDQDDIGFIIRVSTPIAYDNSSHKYYGYYRDVTVDASGNIVNVAAEIRYDAVTLEEC